MKNYARPELKANEERMENVALYSGESTEAFVCPKASNRYTYDYSATCRACSNAYWVVIGMKCKGADGIALNGK
ncbi:MAG: hypothetical protein IJX86_06485 [Lachnospiraceae bacterium]|nr:hypothetical protein [Lachnospiraceae bacterium]MBR3683779.1 hypothetical protein [Lachnospiraceae bacterium]